jgi:hypothetical protein
MLERQDVLALDWTSKLHSRSFTISPNTFLLEVLDFSFTYLHYPLVPLSEYSHDVFQTFISPSLSPPRPHSPHL